MKKIHLSVTAKSHFIQFWPLLIYIIGLTAMPYYFSLQQDLAITILIGKFAGTVLFLLFAPQFIVHLRYYFLNRNSAIEQDGRGIVIKSSTLSKNIKISDIEKIEIIMPYSAYNSSFRMFPSDNYFCGTIHLNSEEQVVVTTLMDPELLWLRDVCPDKTKISSALLCV